MKPYYQHAGITIYHGDCREILPALPKVDLVLTDPPYNCNKDYGVWDDSLPIGEYQEVMRMVSVECRRLAANQAWVAPRYQLPFFLSILPDSHLVVIARGAQGPSRGGWGDQFEIALVKGRPKRQIADLWLDVRLKGEGYFFREDCFGHPGYTPFPIMERFASVLAEHGLIDPFCGTGTSLRAAKDLGLSAIGIEINEQYCEITARRLDQECLDFKGI